MSCDKTGQAPWLPRRGAVDMGTARLGAVATTWVPFPDRIAKAVARGGAAVDHRQEAARLYRDFGPVVYRRCLRLLRDREAARDATQEVFVRLVQDIGRFDDRERAIAWIYRVATNHCLNLLRDARRHGESPLDPDLELAPGEARGAFPERRLAQEVLSRFDEATRAVAVGTFVDGMEREELAAALGISRRTVSRKLGRFLAQAREFLSRSET